mgnify:CR=1 FL=1
MLLKKLKWLLNINNNATKEKGVNSAYTIPVNGKKNNSNGIKNINGNNKLHIINNTKLKNNKYNIFIGKSVISKLEIYTIEVAIVDKEIITKIKGIPIKNNIKFL